MSSCYWKRRCGSCVCDVTLLKRFFVGCNSVSVYGFESKEIALQSSGFWNNSDCCLLTFETERWHPSFFFEVNITQDVIHDVDIVKKAIALGVSDNVMVDVYDQRVVFYFPDISVQSIEETHDIVSAVRGNMSGGPQLMVIVFGDECALRLGVDDIGSRWPILSPGDHEEFIPWQLPRVLDPDDVPAGPPSITDDFMSLMSTAEVGIYPRFPPYVAYVSHIVFSSRHLENDSPSARLIRNKESLQDVVRHMNHWFTAILTDGETQYVYMNSVKEGEKTIVKISRQSMAYVTPLKVPVILGAGAQGRQMTLGSMWLAHVDHCAYYFKVYYPRLGYTDGGGAFNTYLGPQYTDIEVRNYRKLSLIQPILDHVRCRKACRCVFVNGTANLKIVKTGGMVIEHGLGNPWLLDWLVWIVRYPWRKPQQAVVITGIEGSGKTLLIQFFTHLIGPRNIMVIHKLDDLVEKHSTIAANAVLIVCDEATAGSREDQAYAYNVIKGYVTDSTTTVRPLFRQHETARLCASYVFLSNAMTPPFALSQTDRRIFHESMPPHKLPLEIAETLFGLLVDPVAMKTLYYYCMHSHVFTDMFDPVGLPPVTDTMLTSQSMLAPPIQTWWKEMLEDGGVLQELPLHAAFTFPETAFMLSYRQYCMDNNLTVRMKNSVMAAHIRELGGHDNIRTRRHGNIRKRVNGKSVGGIWVKSLTAICTHWNNGHPSNTVSRNFKQ